MALVLREPTAHEKLAVKLLDEMAITDPEAVHTTADLILLALSHREVQDAYERLKERSRWWATV